MPLTYLHLGDETANKHQNGHVQYSDGHYGDKYLRAHGGSCYFRQIVQEGLCRKCVHMETPVKRKITPC